MANAANEWIKEKIKRLRGWSKCAICGSTENVEFAHIKPTKLRGKGRGRKERYYDLIRHPESYRPLCSKHHREYDNEKANNRGNERKN